MLGIEPIRIPCLKLVHVHLEDSFQVIPDSVSTDRQILGNVAELLGQMLPIKLVALEEMLLQNINGLPSLSIEAHKTIQNSGVLLGHTTLGPKSGLLVLVNGHLLYSPFLRNRFQCHALPSHIHLERLRHGQHAKYQWYAGNRDSGTDHRSVCGHTSRARLWV